MLRLFTHQEAAPFDLVKSWIKQGTLLKKLKEVRSGNYNKISRALTELMEKDFNLSTCSVEDLESIHGIGPKTARFFILWTRPDANYAALDVHVLRWLREKGYDVPRSTPSGPKYKRIEKIFLTEAKTLGLTPRQLDEMIWVAGSQYPGGYNPNY